MASQWNKSKNEDTNKQKQQQTYKIMKIGQPVHLKLSTKRKEKLRGIVRSTGGGSGQENQ